MISIRDDIAGQVFRRPELISLSLDFLEESGWDVEPDPSMLWDYFEYISESEGFFMHCAVDETTGMVVGYSIVSYAHVFSQEPFGTTQFLYVKPAYRNYSVARSLLQASHDALVAVGCKYIFANSMSDISTRISRAYSGIIQRMGYVSAGETYRWER